MHLNIFIFLIIVFYANGQFFDFPKKNFNFTWLRQGKIASNITTSSTTEKSTTVFKEVTSTAPNTTPKKNLSNSKISIKRNTKPVSVLKDNGNYTASTTSKTKTTNRNLNNSTTTPEKKMQSTFGTTPKPKENSKVEHLYLNNSEKAQIRIKNNISQNLLPLPADASAALVKPTKYHYYPHNQHIYLLPECAIQQVCNAVYVRLNWTQPLCACPSRYRDPCSASLNSDDQHTTELMIDKFSKPALTLVKTCEPISDMRICRSPRDWSLLALQNIRTGKSHYLIICRCPDTNTLEGPMSHEQPTYASVPGIRVYGMMCVQEEKHNIRDKRATTNPEFPWEQVKKLYHNALWL